MKLGGYKGYSIELREVDGMFVASDDGEEVALSERLQTLRAALDRRERPKPMKPVEVYVKHYDAVAHGTLTSWEGNRGRVTITGRSTVEGIYDLYAVTPENTAKVERAAELYAQGASLQQRAREILETLAHYQHQEVVR